MLWEVMTEFEKKEMLLRMRIPPPPSAHTPSVPSPSSASSPSHPSTTTATTAKSRILYDIPCKVCHDHSSGKHYGIFACDGCAGFFKRSIRRARQYVCKSKSEAGCLVDKTHRNQCRACRLSKCLQAGMNKEAVQHERGPRNSTLRRQMSLYFKESSPELNPPLQLHHPHSHHPHHHHHAHRSLPAPALPPRSLSLSGVATSSSTSLDVESLRGSPPPATVLPSQILKPATNAVTAASTSSSSSSTSSLSSLTSSNTSSTASSSSPLTPPIPPIAPNQPPGLPLGSPLTPSVDLKMNLMLPLPHHLTSGAASALSHPKILRHSSTALPEEMVNIMMMNSSTLDRRRQASSFTIPTSSTLHAPTPRYPHELGLPLFSCSDGVCETAARLLFMNVRWAKHLPAYAALPYRDQLTLLEWGWRELFVLSAAQFLLPVEVGASLASCGLTSETSNAFLVAILRDIKLFQDIITKFKEMCVDPTEYACLKAIVLFKTVWEKGSGGGREVTTELRDVTAVAALQDQAQLALSKYITTAYPSQPFRFGKLLLLLPSLRAVGTPAIVELFFRRTIGSIPIERIVCDMYKTVDF
ncbi:nuclear receptor subfamily 2 group E member 1 [Macrobrachium rosenbergii]|uniref:nuclear receptor subfamily 2 group E member 1 n=1 Tax=Macrobrachium rosenbergii TaxID=79674 RepID=UPI0034D5DA6F